MVTVDLDQPESPSVTLMAYFAANTIRTGDILHTDYGKDDENVRHSCGYTRPAQSKDIPQALQKTRVGGLGPPPKKGVSIFWVPCGIIQCRGSKPPRVGSFASRCIFFLSHRASCLRPPPISDLQRRQQFLIQFVWGRCSALVQFRESMNGIEAGCLIRSGFLLRFGK